MDLQNWAIPLVKKGSMLYGSLAKDPGSVKNDETNFKAVYTGASFGVVFSCCQRGSLWLAA